jgi:hypothetical protein
VARNFYLVLPVPGTAPDVVGLIVSRFYSQDGALRQRKILRGALRRKHGPTAVLDLKIEKGRVPDGEQYFRECHRGRDERGRDERAPRQGGGA